MNFHNRELVLFNLRAEKDEKLCKDSMIYYLQFMVVFFSKKRVFLQREWFDGYPLNCLLLK